MKKDIGIKLLEVLRKQREFFLRNAEGKRIITNPIVYYGLEEEALRLQERIGAENKKKIIAECKEKELPIPNFKKEGIAKTCSSAKITII